MLPKVRIKDESQNIGSYSGLYRNNLRRIFHDFHKSCLIQPRISRLEYAQSIVIPSGPRAGEKYNRENQPVCELILKEFDRDYWSVFLFMWSVQSGKSFVFVNLETCYIAEVLKEDQIVALPDDSMVKTKWSEIREIFIAKGSAHLLPSAGIGGKGGSNPSEVQLTNGAKIRFMTAGSSDAGRSGFTARHVCVDEIDKQTKAQSTSSETSPVGQYEARQEAFPFEHRRFRGTSTIAEEDGFLWSSHQKGSNGHVMLQCPHCGQWVFLEREHLKGWQAANSEVEAMRNAYIECPACIAHWTEEQRIAAVRRCVIAHRGQTIDESGNVHGELPETYIGTVRANGFHDILGKSLSGIAQKEYQSRKSGNPEDLELHINQFFFVTPKKSKAEEAVPLTAQDIITKPLSPLRRGLLPDNTVNFVVGVDMHSQWLQYVVLAELPPQTEGAQGNLLVVDYGELDSGWEVFDKKSGHRRRTGLETEGKKSWFLMLDRLFDKCYVDGWETKSGDKVFPRRVYMDSRYNRPQSKANDDIYVIDEWLRTLDDCRFAPQERKHVCKFCKHTEDAPQERICAVRILPDDKNETHRDKFRMTMGLGLSEREKRKYTALRSPEVLSFGNGWHLVNDKRKQRRYYEIDADRAKLQVQSRFFMPVDTPGTMLLYRTDDINEHHRYALAVTSKRQVEIDGKICWEVLRREDHALDASGIAFMGLEIERAELNAVDYSEILAIEMKNSGY